jgi:hypothetical protein
MTVWRERMNEKPSLRSCVGTDLKSLYKGGKWWEENDFRGDGNGYTELRNFAPYSASVLDMTLFHYIPQ